MSKKLTPVIDGYEVITKLHIYDERYCNGDENFYDDLFKEQNEVLKANGIDYYDTVCGIHHIKGYWVNNPVSCWKGTLYDTIDGLAIKDGVDLVRFSNGNLGFVAYYNSHKDAIEIVHVFK